MITRTIRLADRVSHTLIKLYGWAGRRLIATYRRIAQRFINARATSQADTERTTLQVQSLSSLIVILLAAVITLIIWATSPGSENLIIPILGVAEQAAQSPQTPDDRSILPSGQGTVQTTNDPIQTEGTLLFTMDAGGQTDIFALVPGSTTPIRLTNDPAHDRDPVLSPDGSRIAFSSRRDGNWELYVMDLATGQPRRLTSELAYEGAPSWSPDGEFLAYEAYYNDNLDIYIVRADGSEPPLPLTVSPTADFAPAWSPFPGREIAYVSRRGGDQDIYLISLDEPNEVRSPNLTNSPNADEDRPAWSPDGSQLAYDSQEAGTLLIHTLQVETQAAQVVGSGFAPSWSADGTTLFYLADREEASIVLANSGGTLQAIGLERFAYDLTWASSSLPAALQGEMAFARTEAIPPAYQEDFATDGVSNDPPYNLRTLPDVEVGNPYLADTVDGSFAALRARLQRETGWDVIGSLESAFWTLNHPIEPGQDSQNWHKAGRAFSLPQSLNAGDVPRIEVVPRRVDADLYWDVYIRTEVQDGSLGQPLYDLPWDLYARASGDRTAYDEGGRYREAVPTGYYVNFTHIAREYGWEPVPADSSWYYNWPGILYWQYEKRDGLTWPQAMRQIWTAEEIENELGLSIQAPVPTPDEGG